MQKPYLLLGTIVKPQGVRGEVKLHAETDDPDRLATVTTLYTKTGETYTPLQVLGARVTGGDVYLTLSGVDDRDAAETLRGQAVYIDRAHARPLAENEAYIADMLGMRAEDSQGRPVGTLSDVLQNGGTDVLVFQTPRGPMMAPFLKRLVRSLDTRAGVMVLDSQVLPEVAVYENSDSDDLPGDV